MAAIEPVHSNKSNIAYLLEILLLIWFNFNPNMDK